MKAPIRERREISVRGIVQGVGSDFIYYQAQWHGLAGLVRNEAEGVHTEAEGSPEESELFLQEIKEEVLSLAAVEAVAWRPLVVREKREVRIEESHEGTGDGTTLYIPFTEALQGAYRGALSVTRRWLKCFQTASSTFSPWLPSWRPWSFSISAGRCKPPVVYIPATGKFTMRGTLREGGYYTGGGSSKTGANGKGD